MTQELVARSLGTSRPRAFLTVTLPQIRIAVTIAPEPPKHRAAAFRHDA